jgi:hypothetical protein
VIFSIYENNQSNQNLSIPVDARKKMERFFKRKAPGSRQDDVVVHRFMNMKGKWRRFDP